MAMPWAAFFSPLPLVLMRAWSGYFWQPAPSQHSARTLQSAIIPIKFERVQIWVQSSSVPRQKRVGSFSLSVIFTGTRCLPCFCCISSIAWFFFFLSVLFNFAHTAYICTAHISRRASNTGAIFGDCLSPTGESWGLSKPYRLNLWSV